MVFLGDDDELGAGNLGGGSLRYLLRDEFLTAAGAPLPSPRTCEPGPGTLTAVQTDGQLSIAAGKLVFPVQASPAFGDQGFYGAGLARVVGRALLTQINASVPANAILGWNVTGDANVAYHLGFYVNGAAPQLADVTFTFPVIGAFAGATDYHLALVLRSNGGFIFLKGGAYPAWTLLFVTDTVSAGLVYPAFSNLNSAGTLDYFRVRDLLGAFLTDDGIASLNIAPPLNAHDYVTTADAIHDLTFTTGNPVTGSGVLAYRTLDTQNLWLLIADGTNIDLYSIVATTWTNRLSAGAVLTPATTYTIRVIVQGSKHNIYLLSGANWTKIGAEVNVATPMDAVPTIQEQSTATANRLKSYPRTSALYNALEVV